MNRVFTFFDRVSTKPRLLVLGLLVAALLASVNLLDFPLSVPFMRRTTGHPFLDMCAFCSAHEVNTWLDAMGATGQHSQLLLLGTIDIAIPVASFAFGSMAMSLLLRGGSPRIARLRWLPVIAMVLDFIENALIAALLGAYPNRSTTVAWAMGLTSGLKFSAYAATVAVVVILGLMRLGSTGRPQDERFAPPAKGA